MMHQDQLEIGPELVARLLAEQCPTLASLPITRVRSMGTVNAMFRIGADLVVRLPLTAADDHLRREVRWLPMLRPRLPIRIPDLILAGRATRDFPHRWAVLDWIPGQPFDRSLVVDEASEARRLARFVRALRHLDLADEPSPAGRHPLSEIDDQVRAAIIDSTPEIDTGAALDRWRRALDVPAYGGPHTWIHGDLLPPNLVLDRGHIVGVIDFGNSGVGDPAVDLIAAWSLFGPHGRQVYLEEVGLAPEDWERAAGLALAQAALIIPYYRRTNPGMVALAVRTVEQLLR